METTMALLSDDDITARLDRLPGWERDGDSIAREFKFDDFQGSVDFVNRITPPAEEMNHHPDIAISWNKVTLTLSTHSEGGLTENDFELATRIDSLA
jgi:4a-hydroxytetrahydrobiopterin dehydratase